MVVYHFETRKDGVTYQEFSYNTDSKTITWVINPTTSTPEDMAKLVTLIEMMINYMTLASLQNFECTKV